jgi:hypothetical protein
MENKRKKNATKSLSITCLPDHIWERIIGYSKKQKKLMRTCKFFNDLISKSHHLMDRMTLVLNDCDLNDRAKMAVILKSNREITSVRFKDVELSGFKFGFILGHFQNSIKKITFDKNCLCPPDILVDLINMLPNLEELDICAVDQDFDDSSLSVEFSKGRKLKKVCTEDATILQYMPEIEDLSCRVFSQDSKRVFKEYLESHSQLQKLNVRLEQTRFPTISSESIHSELNTFALKGSYRSNHQRLDNSTTDFVTNHAASLKHLAIDGLLYKWDIFQVRI